MSVLAVDVGGTHVKILASGEKDSRKFDSGADMTAQQMVDGVNKLAKAGGAVIKKKHILAKSDGDAVQQALDSPDCPICDVLRDGEKVGSIL